MKIRNKTKKKEKKRVTWSLIFYEKQTGFLLLEQNISIQVRHVPLCVWVFIYLFEKFFFFLLNLFFLEGVPYECMGIYVFMYIVRILYTFGFFGH